MNRAPERRRTAPAASSRSPPRGREAKKLDKRRRIREAAAALFRQGGGVARRRGGFAGGAAVATGTLFLYVRDKDEALALVYGDEVDAALEVGTRSRPARARFVPGVVHRIRGLYALYAEHPDLAMRYLRRIPTLEDAEKVVHEARNARFLGVLRDELERAVASGELRADLEVALAAKTLFAVVRMSVFGWLAGATGPGRPSVEGGLRDIRATLRLLVSGLAPEVRSSAKTAKRT